MPLKLLLPLALVLGGCGVDDAAPSPENRPRPATCPTMEALAPNALGLLRERRLPGLQRLLAERISDDEVSALLDAALKVIGSLSAEELQRLLSIGKDERLRGLIPTIGILLEFILDTPEDPPRAGLFTATGRVLQTCEGETVLTAVEQLVSAPELPATLESLGAALALDPVQQVLAESGGFGRRGITAILCNIAAAMMTPEFDFERNVRVPLGALPALPLDEPPLSDLLDNLGALLADPVLPALADLMCCEAYGVSSCAAIPPGVEPTPGDPVFTWLIYDLFVAQGSIDIEGLLATAGELVADPALRAALAPLGKVVRQLAADPDLRATLTRLVVTLLDPQIAAEVLPDLVVLLKAGGVEELLAVVDAIVSGCDQEAM